MCLVVKRGIQPHGRPVLDEEVILIRGRLRAGNVSSVLAKGGVVFPYNQV